MLIDFNLRRIWPHKGAQREKPGNNQQYAEDIKRMFPLKQQLRNEYKMIEIVDGCQYHIQSDQVSGCNRPERIVVVQVEQCQNE